MTKASEAETARAPQIPLLIGVTGHRDLRPEQIPGLRTAVRRWLETLRKRFADSPLEVASALGPGADLLVTEESLAIGLDCTAVLPMPVDLCRSEFEDPKERDRFDAALGRCRRVMVCPLRKHLTPEQVARSGPERAAQYAEASELIAANAFLLLALWDGRTAHHPTGTAQTVEFRLAQKAWLDEDPRPGHQELLPNLPPELVYHIVASSREALSEASGRPSRLEPLQEGYRSSLLGTLEATLPVSAEVVAARTGQLNRDLRRHAAAIAAATPAINPTHELADPPASVAEAGRLFSALDWLAGRLHRAVLAAIAGTATLTLIMALSLLAYSHPLMGKADPSKCGASVGESRPAECPTGSSRGLILGYLGTFAILLGVNRLVRARAWQRRHLEVRALAEGLRVELFWTIAGVPAAGGAAASHRRILKQADPGLEWIPNAIRATSLALAPLRHVGIPGGIDYTVNHWIGTHHASGSGSEQLHYFWDKGQRKSKHADWVDGMTAVAIVGTVIVALLLAGGVLSGDPRTLLLYVVGLLPLVAGVLEDFIQKTAERELRRQYHYMFDVFRSAHDRLLRAESDAQRLHILSLLGHAALSEHAEWLFLHRDRPIDRSRLQ